MTVLQIIVQLNSIQSIKVEANLKLLEALAIQLDSMEKNEASMEALFRIFERFPD
jgi:hypothetical protein